MDIGTVVPDLDVTLADGTTTMLAGLGLPLVVYFYPKADTTGCTREALAFTALGDAFQAAGVRVVGVSKDPPAALVKFAARHALGVTLASDIDGAVCDAFGVWGQKSMYGRSYMGIERATFLFDRNAVLVRTWRKVRVPGHAEAVLDAVAAL